jgi:small GTP-binding protein
MPQEFTYDVFLSHSSKDKPAVLKLAKRLKKDGLRVWLDDWEIKPGAMIGLKIEKGLEQSRALILVMSANAFASEWVTLERHTVLFRDPTNERRRFIPLRLDNAEMPDTLKQFAYVDWRQKSGEEYAKLLEASRRPEEKARPLDEQESVQIPSIVLKGHNDIVYDIAFTPDGNRVVSGSHDHTMVLWDIHSREKLVEFPGHSRGVVSVAVTHDGRKIVSGSADDTLKVWELESGRCLHDCRDHTGSVNVVAVTPDSRRAISGSGGNSIKVWDIESGACILDINAQGRIYNYSQLAITSDGNRIIAGFEHSGEKTATLGVWNVETGECLFSLEGHTGIIRGVAVDPSGKFAVSGSEDKTIKVWDLESGKRLATLEGHTSSVRGLAITPDGRLCASGSQDKTVRIWDLETGKTIAILKGHTQEIYGVSISDDGRQLASASYDKTVRVWDISAVIDQPVKEDDTTRYTNAKVLLVGESGVGKTGLAYRLTEDCFKESISTDAAWATHLELPQNAAQEGIEREIWLWDFAGQADYRLIHQLYMDQTALAVLVFNPQSENPFEGLGLWDRDLQRAARREFRKLLVAGRIDRGGLMVSRNTIGDFQQERGFTDYIETSALLGTGCDELRDAIIGHIPWEDIPWTTSPRIFRLLKEEITKLKDEGIALMRMGELKQQLEMRLPGESFAIDELRAVVGLLAGPGVVWQLEFGDFVLLQPERINAYAAAVIRSVRAHTEEIGCIAEEDVLAGNLDYQDMKRLPHEEEQIVLRAMHQTFVDHGLCLREHTEKGTLLIFPSYFRRERPSLVEHPIVLVTYKFNGALDEIYATLVVLLYHAAAVEQDQLWRFAADFKTPAGKRLGLKMTKKAEGAAELEVYFEPGISNDVQVTFIRYVHEHLSTKASDVVRMRNYVCPHCQTPVEGRRAIEVRLSKGLKDIFCSACGKPVLLWDLIEEKFASEEFKQRVRDLEERAKSAIDNESRELILVGHTYAIAGEAGQIYRQYTNSDHGIDGEIEFKDYEGKASGARLYMQLKSGDSYLYKRKRDGAEVFTIQKARHSKYWQQQAYPVMLVIRTSDGEIRWMNVTEYLKEHGAATKQIVYEGEPFTALNVARMRDHLLGLPK